MKKSTLDLATIGLFVLGLCYFFWPTLTSIHNHWSQVSANYSHGYLLLITGTYLFYEARTTGSNSNSYKYWQVFTIPLIGASLIWAIAGVVQVQIIQQLSILAITYCFLSLLFGIQGAKDALFPIGIIVLAIPIWGSIIELLQYLTVIVCTFGLSLLKIPAHIHQFYIQIPDGVIHVADSCSGLNYFLIAVSLGAIQAQLSYHSVKRKLLLTLFAAAIGLFSNWIRVFSLIVIGHVTKMQSPLMESHFWHGWIIFGLSILPIFIVSHKYKEEVAGVDPTQKEKEHSHNLDITTPSILISCLALLLAFSGPLALNLIPKSESYFNEDSMIQNLSSWSFLDTSNRNWSPTYIGADKIITGSFHKNLQRAQLDIYLYLDQRQGKELVSYKNKIANENWKQISKNETIIDNTQIVESQLKSTHGISQKALLYWYQVGNNVTNNENKVKILQLQSFLKGRSDAALIAVNSDCKKTCEESFEFLKQLVKPIKIAYTTALNVDNLKDKATH